MKRVSAQENLRVRRLYERSAARYDHATRRFEPLRLRAVHELELKPGYRVIDVACGTGVNFAALHERVGPTGAIVGVDLSPQMLHHADDRVHSAGWSNITLIKSTVEEADLGDLADAALFSLTHDVLQSGRAVRRVVNHLRSGARVVAFGPKYASAWKLPANAYIRWKSRAYITDFRGLDAPWQRLEDELADLEVQELAFGGAYLASGRVP